MSMTLTEFMAVITVLTDVITNLFNSMDSIILISTLPSWSLLDLEALCMLYVEFQRMIEELSH